jgi:hypothetical protein
MHTRTITRRYACLAAATLLSLACDSRAARRRGYGRFAVAPQRPCVRSRQWRRHRRRRRRLVLHNTAQCDLSQQPRRHVYRCQCLEYSRLLYRGQAGGCKTAQRPRSSSQATGGFTFGPACGAGTTGPTGRGRRAEEVTPKVIGPGQRLLWSYRSRLPAAERRQSLAPFGFVSAIRAPGPAGSGAESWERIRGRSRWVCASRRYRASGRRSGRGVPACR